MPSDVQSAPPNTKTSKNMSVAGRIVTKGVHGEYHSQFGSSRTGRVRCVMLKSVSFGQYPTLTSRNGVRSACVPALSSSQHEMPTRTPLSLNAESVSKHISSETKLTEHPNVCRPMTGHLSEHTSKRGKRYLAATLPD